MKQPRWVGARRAMRGALSLATVGLVLVACSQHRSEPEIEPLTMTEVRATSSTSFLLRFSAPLGEGADAAENYLVRDPDGKRLQVLAAHPREEGLEVILATEPQLDVDYTITVRDVRPASGPGEAIEIHAPQQVTGSTRASPAVADAVALSSTAVLVSFYDPETGATVEMNDDAVQPEAYRFEPRLEVLGAAFAEDGDDRSRVVLTTAEMEEQTYVLRVGYATAGHPPRLLDRSRSEASFAGIAPDDETPPKLLEAYATDARTVVVSFSEPVQDHGADAARYEIHDESSGRVDVTAAELGSYATRVTLTTRSLEPDETYTLTTGGLADLAGNTLEDGASVTFRGVAEGSDGRAPRVTGAASTGPERVLVAFSEPMRGGLESAENPEHYAIIGSATLQSDVSAQAIVSVIGAELAADGRSVTLTTRPQSEISYTLRVTNVSDLDGDALVGTTRDHPFEIEFFGTAESGSGTDADGDGLSDAAEQRGWTVRVVAADGGVSHKEVTSDPDKEDTDDDGLSDALEKSFGTNPRAADTDADGIGDRRELNETFSEPLQQDSDGDGLEDGLEVDTFGTSPRTADTDGDQFDDAYEVDADNRHPRIADLPTLHVDVGAVDLQLDVRFDEKTSQGSTTLDRKSASATLQRSSSTSVSTGRSSTFSWFVKAGLTAGVEAGTSGAKLSTGFKAEGGISGSNTTTFSNGSSQAAQRAYATTLASERTASAEATVSRVIEGASVAAEVSLTNPTNVAFTVRNIEITVLAQDPQQGTGLVPVATLVSATGADVDVGPLTENRGPFRFHSFDPYPAVVERLMRNPRGLVFRVANYSLEDEHGRRFAFVEQDVNDRTAFLEIHYGGAPEREVYRVATNGTFDEGGEPTGISMGQVMEDVLGLTYAPPEEDDGLSAADRETSYSTRIVDGVEVLTRVRDLGYDPFDANDDDRWWVLTPDGLLMPDTTGTDFRAAVVRSGSSFAFKFVRDADEDGLTAALEALASSSDVQQDTDGDGIDDGVEVYGYELDPQDDDDPWIVRLEDGRDAYRTHSNPARRDTDGDGLSDCQELVFDADREPLACATIVVYEDQDGHPTLNADGNGAAIATLTLTAPTDPANPDTDGDGIPDLDEVVGLDYENLDGEWVALRPDADGPAINPLSRDSDGDRLSDLQELRLGTNPTGADQDDVLDDDGDGLVNRVETTGWDVTYLDADGVQQTGRVTSDPDRFDTDGDGLSDLEELEVCRDRNGDEVCSPDEYFGPMDPRDPDTDGDGLWDREELDGVAFPSDASDPVRFTDPLSADTDGDGLSDGEEVTDPWMVEIADMGGYEVFSDPLRADADGDGMSDALEKNEAGSDPERADTDEDGTTDMREHDRGTDPLRPDYLVSIVYEVIRIGPDADLLEAGADCEVDNDAQLDGEDEALWSGTGDFQFELGVRVPSYDGSFVSMRQVVLTTHATYNALDCGSGSDGTGCRDGSGEDSVIRMAATDQLPVVASREFAIGYEEIFALEGMVREMSMETNDDDEYGPAATNARYDFGGLGDESGGVYRGGDLAAGLETFSFRKDDVAIGSSGSGATCSIAVEGLLRVR